MRTSAPPPPVETPVTASARLRKLLLHGHPRPAVPHEHLRLGHRQHQRQVPLLPLEELPHRQAVPLVLLVRGQERLLQVGGHGEHFLGALRLQVAGHKPVGQSQS